MSTDIEPVDKETARRQAEVLADREFMAGVYEALAEHQRGVAPTHWKDLRRWKPKS